MKHIRKWIGLILIFIICISTAMPAYAHNRDEHDEDLEYVLFGDREYKKTHKANTTAVTKIKALEDAAYLCVDQFNGSGKDALKNLQKEKVPDIPETIDEIDFKSNSAHRYYTHRGWNVTTNPDKAHWSTRKL